MKNPIGLYEKFDLWDGKSAEWKENPLGKNEKSAH
jgi:hypothetical protein